MSIASINLSALVGTGRQQTGTFTTNALGDVTATLSGNAAANATVLSVVSSVGFESGADIITVPGGGNAGATTYLEVVGFNLQASNQLSIPNPSLVTGISSGAVVTRWNRVPIAGRPVHIRVTRASNGDYWDWVDGMEPFSANKSIGGSMSLDSLIMLSQVGAFHIAPGVLVANETYNVIVDNA